MPQYKLHYFDMRGRAEFLRQILYYAGIPFEDVRIKRVDWPNYKTKMTFGQIPILEVDGKQIPQSYAIARFVAKKCDLNGPDEFASAKVDAFADQWKDFLVEIKPFTMLNNGVIKGDLEESKKNVLIPAMKKYFLYFECASSSASGFLVGDSLTWVDILVAEHVTTIAKAVPLEMQKYPKIMAHAERVQQIPKIKEWIERRPESKV